MSSRRKSSTPCMVRVICDLPEQGDQEEMEVDSVSADNDVSEKGSSEYCGSSGENSQDQLVNLENPDQQMFSSVAEDKLPEQLEREEQSVQEEEEEEEEEEERDATVEDVGDGEVKDREVTEPETDLPPKRQQRGYECKYCPFSTYNLDEFKEHVDSSHPNVILNPLYLCAVCNFRTKKFDSLTDHNESQHPGEMNFKFKRVKMNNQTILEQTIEGKDNSAECDLTIGQGENDDSGAFPSSISTTVKSPDIIQSLFQGNQLKSHPDSLLHKDQITAVNINGTVIIPEPTILQGLSHVMPLLQRPPNFNCVPKIAIPLNSTKYNPSLDNNLTLITSFNRFPYPTHAELSWLTAASKHPEEQIKVWFTTQRLKQGITWSPEEVEEARKKMFNGSIPATHHTFTVLPTSPVSQPSAKASQPPLVHTTMEHSNHVKTSVSNGLTTVTTTSFPAGITVSSSHVFKRPLPTMFGPEPKRPVMAVAPHSEERLLMAPPPPPPPLKDRLPMAPPPVPMEMKRSSAAVPLMPPPLSSSLSSCLSSKGKLLPAAASLSSASHRIKPVVSLPSIVFPESLTRRSIVPPPIIAPPYKNYLMSHPLSISSKEKHPITHAVLAPDMKIPNSPTLIPPQIRRPTIIQSARAPVKVPSQMPSFPSDGCRLKEQQAVELKASFPRGDKLLPLLSEANSVSRMDARWPHNHQSPRIHNNGVIQLDGSEPPAPKPEQRQKSSVPTHFPLLERMKGKTSEQLKVLEENFQRNSFPTLCDVDNLAAVTRLSRLEIDSWFMDRRSLRDNLEQALLNSMGTKRVSGSSGVVVDKKQHQHQQPIQQNGIHKPSNGGGHLNSPPPILPIVAPVPTPLATSIVPPTSCSVPADSRSLALLKDVFAQTRWPSPEEYNQLEARTGLVRTDLVRWFKDSRSILRSGALEWTDLFNKMNSIGSSGVGVTCGQGAPVSSSENSPGIIQRCQEGSPTSNISSTMLEVDLGRLAEQRVNSLSSQQQQELQDWFASRLRQQNAVEKKIGGQNGGGPREVFGSWLEDGQTRRGQELILDREKKMVEDTSGRLTG